MPDEIVRASSGNDFIDSVRNMIGTTEPRVNCKLCQSKFKAEAETKAEQEVSISAIHRWLLAQGEDISYNAINNHIRYHFNTSQNEINLSAYAHQLARWSKIPKEDEQLLRRYIEALDMEAMYLISKNPDCDLVERRKNDELFSKLASQLDVYRQQLRKLNGEKQQVEIVITSLNKIIDFKISGSDNPGVRQALTDVVEMLRKELGDMPIDGGV